MITTAAVLTEINRPLKVEKLTIPELKFGQVLVKIAYSGICHSQLNEIRGLKGEDKFLPHTLGHEGSGVVEAIGLGVKKVKPGDRVVLTWIKGIGADIQATSYRMKNGSVVNSGAISTFMTRAVISENRLVKIPKEMPLREASLLGCAIPTGAGAVINTIRLSKNNTLAIFGMGGIGLSALLAAKLKQTSIIIAIDISDSKLSAAKWLGATHLINDKNNEALEEILKITDGKGVDFSIECAGKRESMETAFKSVRDAGGLCILVGNLPKGETVSIDPFDLIKGRRIIGTWGGETDPDRDILRYADWFQHHKFEINKLISHEYKIEEINKAMSQLSKGEALRILINLT